MLWRRKPGCVLLPNIAPTASADFNLPDSSFKTIVTKSKPTDFPSLLREKLSTTQTVERHKVQTEALIQETCEKCGRKEVRFTSVQLRSADEGATNFYTCECGHKYVSVASRNTECLLTSTADGVKIIETLWKSSATMVFIYNKITRYPKPIIIAKLYFWCLISLQNAETPEFAQDHPFYTAAVAFAASGIRAYSAWPLCS